VPPARVYAKPHCASGRVWLARGTERLRLCYALIAVLLPRRRASEIRSALLAEPAVATAFASASGAGRERPAHCRAPAPKHTPREPACAAALHRPPRGRLPKRRRKLTGLPRG